MEDDHDHRNLPTGIDIGSVTTKGAVIDEKGVRVLEIDGEKAIQTKLSLSPDGFSVGDAGPESQAEKITPEIIQSEEAETVQSATGTLPLTNFLRELNVNWEPGSAEPIESFDFVRSEEQSDAESERTDRESKTVDEEDHESTTASESVDSDAHSENTKGDEGDLSEEDNESLDSDSGDSDTSNESEDSKSESSSSDKGWTKISGDDSNDDDSMSTDGGTPRGAGDQEQNPENRTVISTSDEGTQAKDPSTQSTPADQDYIDEPSETSTADNTSGSSKTRKTTISVPGAAASEDIARVETAAAAAGYEDVQAVRNPVAVAATKLPEVSEEHLILVGDIGTEYASFAIVSVSPESIDVKARSTLKDHGRRDLDDAVAHYVLQELNDQHDVTIELEEQAMNTVRGAAHEVLDEIGPTTNPGDIATITLELTEGVEVIDGGWLGEEKLTVDLEITINDCYEILADQLRTVQNSIAELLTATDYSTTTIDDVLLVGDGTRPVAVTHAIEKKADQQSKVPKYGGRYEAGAIGAAILSAEREKGSSSVGTETYDKVAEIRALDSSGPTNRSITNVASGPHTKDQLELTLENGEQLSGVFELWFRHRQTDRRTLAGRVVCSNIPADSTTLTITFHHEQSELPDTIDPVDVIDVTVSSEENNQSPVDVSVDEDIELPWLVFSDVDASPEENYSDGTDEEQYTDVLTARERIIDSIDEADIIEIAYTLRNKLWGRAFKQEEGFEREELEMLLTEFDQKLSRFGAELINPDLGSQVDGNRHRVIETLSTDQQKGSILEVKQPGLVVEDTIVEPAVVVASD